MPEMPLRVAVVRPLPGVPAANRVFAAWPGHEPWATW